jgi:hypothetical protein
MRLTLSPRKAASTLERLVVWLDADDVTRLVYDGSLEANFLKANGGPTVKLTLETPKKSTRWDVLKDDPS